MPENPYNTQGLPHIRAGSGRTIITPPVGTSLAGYFHDRVSDGVRDELRASAVVFEAGGERIALVSCDLIALRREIVDPAKAIIQEQTCIPSENVLICCTHTHTGPETRCGRVVPWSEEYLATLPGLIAESVVLAAQAMSDCILCAGRQCEPDLGTIRLGRKRDATEVFSKVDVLGPTSSVDPELISLFVRDDEGQVRAVVINYANHGDVISGHTISADWFGEIAQVISAVYGEHVVTVFLNGCCGDINHIMWEPTRIPQRGPAKAVQVGRAVAGVAMNAGEKGEPIECGQCAASLRKVDIPYYTRDEAMRQEVRELAARTDLGAFEQYIVNAFDAWPHDGRIADVPVHVLRLGEIAIVGLPGEIFTDWGKVIKHWSPAKYTLIAELANDWFGYIPTTDQAQRGGYGAKPILSRQLCSDGGRMMSDAATVMLHELWGKDEA